MGFLGNSKDKMSTVFLSKKGEEEFLKSQKKLAKQQAQSAKEQAKSIRNQYKMEKEEQNRRLEMEEKAQRERQYLEEDRLEQEMEIRKQEMRIRKEQALEEMKMREKVDYIDMMIKNGISPQEADAMYKQHKEEEYKRIEKENEEKRKPSSRNVKLIVGVVIVLVLLQILGRCCGAF